MTVQRKRKRRPLALVCIATAAFITVVATAALLGLPAGWLALLFFGGLPFILGLAAIVGLRATDSRMAKYGPGVLSALGPGEIRELPVPPEPMTRLGWRSAWANLPAMLPRRRLGVLAAVATAGAIAGGLFALNLAGDLEPWHLGLCITLFALCGASASALLPLGLWAAIAHRDAPLARDTRRLLDNSINPVNDRIRVNLSRVDELQQAITQRRIVYPLLLPIAMCASVAVLLACAAQLTITSGQDFPPIAGFASTAMMLWLPLATLGRVEQIALALTDLEDSDESS